MPLSKVLRAGAVVLGLLLIAAALVTAFFITPNYVARLPGDTDTKRTYKGTFRQILDSKALAKGASPSKAVKKNVPMAVERHVKVEKTSGGKALVSDSRSTTAGGKPVDRITWKYAVDRKDLHAVGDHPDDWRVEDARGLTVSWPFDADKTNYQGWVPEARTTTPVKYVGTQKKDGLETYEYRSKVAPAPIKDKKILASLPKAVPQSVLKQLAGGGGVPAAQGKKLAAALPKLGDPVPLSYTYQSNDKFWVDPKTGVVVDVERSQQRVAGVTAPGSSTFVPLLPVSDVSYAQTDESVSAAADDARDGSDSIRLFGTILPIIAGILGALLVLGGLLLGRRRARNDRAGQGGYRTERNGPGQDPGGRL